MIRRHTDYMFEHYERAHDTEHIFPLPFDTESDPELIYISENGLKAVLGFLVPDNSPEDPFDGDEGEFYQFNSRYNHDISRPDYGDFKRIIRANPGRVFTVCTAGDGYAVDEGPFTVADTKGSNGSISDQAIDYAAGYYIAPEDATDPAAYAKAVLGTYSDYCNGNVYGVVVWIYERSSIDDSWGEPDRENECWGYYGSDDYTAEELNRVFEYAIHGNDPARHGGY
jgi:hypothetical protein